MALPTILYDSASGSDGDASNAGCSGAGPTTALTGTSADPEDVENPQNVYLDGSPDLSGVATDGSHVIWINTTAGTRHLFKITAVDNTAKFVSVTPTPAAFSAKRWAIGGKRKTLVKDTSRIDLADYGVGWAMELTDSGTYDIGAAMAVPTGVTIRSASGQRGVINTTANVETFRQATGCRFIRIKLTTTSGTKTATYGFHPSSSISNTYMEDVIVDGLAYAVYGDWTQDIFAWNCEFKNCTRGIYAQAVNYYLGGCTFLGCWIHDNTSDGVFIADAAHALCTLEDCIIEGNGGDGVTTVNSNTSNIVIRNCVIDGNTGDGIDINKTVNTAGKFVIDNCIISNNGGYGINAGADWASWVNFAGYNAFYNNTSGARNNITAGTGDVTLTGDPYTNRAAADFSLNNTAGAGAACRAAGWPGAFPSAICTGYEDIGPVQHQDPAGGGGGVVVHSGMRGGFTN